MLKLNNKSGQHGGEVDHTANQKRYAKMYAGQNAVEVHNTLIMEAVPTPERPTKKQLQNARAYTLMWHPNTDFPLQ